MSNIQLRGHCPCCARVHAVTPSGLATHGYTIKNGWFQGACPGGGHPPIETCRIKADAIVKMLGELAEDALAQAAALRTGRVTPVTCGTNDMAVSERGRLERVRAPWAEATPYQRQREVEHQVLGLNRRSRRAAVDQRTLAALIQRVHGQPLIEVIRPPKPEPVQRGDQRVDAHGRVLTCTGVDGARVYANLAKPGGVFKFRTTTRAWRAMAVLSK